MLLFFDSKKKIFYSFAFLFLTARVAELVDALDSKSSSFGVWVRFPPRVRINLKRWKCKRVSKKKLASFLNRGEVFPFMVFKTTCKGKNYYIIQSHLEYKMPSIIIEGIFVL